MTQTQHDHQARSNNLRFRKAVRADVPAIVALLADDELGARRESLDDVALRGYLEAFEEIASDPSELLCVAQLGAEVVGTLQLSFIPGLSRGGAIRCQIEAVRVSSAHRRQRIGEALIEWAVGECRARGCSLVQLTTDKRRLDAHRFYERLGFAASHVGFKREL